MWKNVIYHLKTTFSERKLFKETLKSTASNESDVPMMTVADVVTIDFVVVDVDVDVGNENEFLVLEVVVEGVDIVE